MNAYNALDIMHNINQLGTKFYRIFNCIKSKTDLTLLPISKHAKQIIICNLFLSLEKIKISSSFEFFVEKNTRI